MLIAENQESINLWNNEQNKYGLETNTVEAQIVIITNKHRYLGIILNNCGALKGELNNKIKTTGRLYYSLNNCLLKNRRQNTSNSI